VTVFDINAEMLEVGKQRARTQGEHRQQCAACRTCAGQQGVVLPCMLREGSCAGKLHCRCRQGPGRNSGNLSLNCCCHHFCT
jgi:hypothetical protein